MRAAIAIGLTLACAGCDLSMTRQARPAPARSADLWPGGPQIAAPPEGVQPVDASARAAAEKRPPLTLALLERGRDRYRIYCQPCHGARGRGDGPVVQRGFPAPPSYDLPRLLAAPAGHIYDVQTKGYGLMFSYADRLTPPDRWAVAAYVRALQLADLREAAAAGVTP